MLSIEYYFQDSMIMIKEHFQTSRNYSKTLTFDWPHFSREMLGHSPSALWEGKILFGQYKKSRMQRKVDVLLAQRLHIFLLNQDVLIRNFSVWFSQSVPIWSLVDFSGVTFFHVGSFERMISRFHFFIPSSATGS